MESPEPTTTNKLPSFLWKQARTALLVVWILLSGCSASRQSIDTDSCWCGSWKIYQEYLQTEKEHIAFQQKEDDIFDEQVVFQAEILWALASWIDDELTRLVREWNRELIWKYIETNLGFEYFWLVYQTNPNINIPQNPSWRICNENYKDLVDESNAAFDKAFNKSRESIDIKRDPEFVYRLVCRLQLWCINDIEKRLLSTTIGNGRPALAPFYHWTIPQFIELLVPLAQTFDYEHHMSVIKKNKEHFLTEIEEDYENKIKHNAIKYIFWFMNKAIQKDDLRRLLEKQCDQLLSENPTVGYLSFEELTDFFYEHTWSSSSVYWDMGSFMDVMPTLQALFSNQVRLEHYVSEVWKQRDYDDRDIEEEEEPYEPEEIAIIKAEEKVEKFGTNNIRVRFSQDVSTGRFIENIQGYSVCGYTINISFVWSAGQGFTPQYFNGQLVTYTNIIVWDHTTDLHNINQFIQAQKQTFEGLNPNIEYGLSINVNDNTWWQNIAKTKYNIQQ